MNRLRHRWSAPDRQSSELSVRTCTKCGLVCRSNHDWQTRRHWKEYTAAGSSENDPKLTEMPKCTA